MAKLPASRTRAFGTTSGGSAASRSDRTTPKTTPLIVVLSGPSGVGKDTLLERMAQLGNDHHFTVTATTRAPRPAERDGINHFFVSVDQFLDMRSKGQLLEWAEVYGNYYGVPRQQVRDALARGKHVMVRVDVQGARRIREIVPEAVFVFVKPPSEEVLRKHLVNRGVNTEADMARRLAAAKKEMAEANSFDYVITNKEDDLDSTVRAITEIIEKESTRMPPRRTAL